MISLGQEYMPLSSKWKKNLSNLNEFKAFKKKTFFEILVNCFIRQNVISERFPTCVKNHQLCAMDIVIHREITLILVCKSAIQPKWLFDVYLFVPFTSMSKISVTSQKSQWLHSFEALRSSS